MATVASFTASPTTVASGGSTRLTASFTTTPGTPDKILTGRVQDPAGVTQANVQVTFQGTPGEVVPTVVAGPIAGQWSLVVDSGTLTSVGGNAFDWKL